MFHQTKKLIVNWFVIERLCLGDVLVCLFYVRLKVNALIYLLPKFRNMMDVFVGLSLPFIFV